MDEHSPLDDPILSRDLIIADRTLEAHRLRLEVERLTELLAERDREMVAAALAGRRRRLGALGPMWRAALARRR